MANCDCPTPKGALMVSVLHVVKYIDGDGVTWREDLSHDSGGKELEWEEVIELADWVQMAHRVPMIADMVRDYLDGEDDDEEGQPAEL